MAINLLLIQRYGAEGASMLGILHAMRGMGTALGPIILKKYIQDITQMATWITLCAIIGFIWSDIHWIQVLCLCVWGMGTGHNWVLASTKIQTQASSSILGRLTAIDFLFITLTQSVICLITAYIYDYGYDIYQTSLILLIPLSLILLWVTLKEIKLLRSSRIKL